MFHEGKKKMKEDTISNLVFGAIVIVFLMVVVMGFNSAAHADTVRDCVQMNKTYVNARINEIPFTTVEYCGDISEIKSLISEIKEVQVQK
jgi:hypothetical protein